MRQAAPFGLLALVACQPVVYELLDGASATEALTGQVPSTMSDETASASTDPPPMLTEGPPVCFDAALECGGPSCLPCPPGGKCSRPEDCLTGACDGGVCGEPPQCVFAEDCPPDPCRAGKCSLGQCVYEDLDGAGCDDGDPCSEFAVCVAGNCVGKPRDCGGFDGPCRQGFCNPNTGKCAVEFADEGMPCDDGLTCTIDDFCVEGACVGKPWPPFQFTEFSEPQGWQADPPWEFGPALMSACAANGFEDPAEDHSPSLDNALAGAKIGGCLPPEPLPVDVCLTSPPYDLLGPEPVLLQYWSRLSAPPPPGHARVDVWIGGSWEPIWSTEGAEYNEPDWTQHTFDLSKYAAPGLAVRFCHHQPEPQPPTSGWSVDDVFVGAPECQPQPP